MAVSDRGNGRTSLNRCELVGLSRPDVDDECLSAPTVGVWRGLKSSCGEADDIKVECEISSAPSTGVGLDWEVDCHRILPDALKAGGFKAGLPLRSSVLYRMARQGRSVCSILLLLAMQMLVDN